MVVRDYGSGGKEMKIKPRKPNTIKLDVHIKGNASVMVTPHTQQWHAYEKIMASISQLNKIYDEIDICVTQKLLKG